MRFFRRKSKIPLQRGDTLGGSTPLIMMDQVKPMRGGRRFRRRRSAFDDPTPPGRWVLRGLVVLLLAGAIWAGASLVDGPALLAYLREVLFPAPAPTP